METLFEIVKWILPALMVFMAVWLVFTNFRKSEGRRQSFELRMKDRRAIIPIRLQAHERMLLFLERISPEALVMRLQRPNLNVQELHSLLLKTIRQEWDYNVSQQLYLSDEAWTLIKNARENVVKLINSEAGKLKPSDAAMKLSQSILEENSGANSPTTEAIKALKGDIRQLF
jgi:hypothetical protein